MTLISNMLLSPPGFFHNHYKFYIFFLCELPCIFYEKKPISDSEDFSTIVHCYLIHYCSVWRITQLHGGNPILQIVTQAVRGRPDISYRWLIYLFTSIHLKIYKQIHCIRVSYMYIINDKINPLSTHDPIKHHFISLKTHLILLQLRVLERKFRWNWFTSTWRFSLNHLHSLQVENCDNENDNGKFRLERVKGSKGF